MILEAASRNKTSTLMRCSYEKRGGHVKVKVLKLIEIKKPGVNRA